MYRFSRQATSLWAKKSRNSNLLWLSLPVHLSDTAEIARLLWTKWVPEGVKRRIAAGLPNGTVEDAGRLFVFLAAAHDIGKATPVFAAKECGYAELDNRIYDQIISAGLPLEDPRWFIYRSKTPHALASQVLLVEAGCPESVAVVLGSHHGKPPGIEMLDHNQTTFYMNYYLNKAGKSAWKAVQEELIRFALQFSGYENTSELPEPDIPGQVLLSALLITADWIASDSELFPYMNLDERHLPDSSQRATNAWKQLDFKHPWDPGNSWMNSDLFNLRFGIESPYSVQRMTGEILNHVYDPGIMVIEAPMGMGKTEAALVAAEILAEKTKRRGVFFALPTQATSDGIFPRMLDWVSRLDADDPQSVRLMHGKAQFNERFLNLAYGTNIDDDGDESNVYVHEWFMGRKRGILDDFVVGTIDQLLMAALKQKHVMLRHLGLANKVVIIDECHAFDAYMNRYLERALNWLGKYGVPVILLSATLPSEQRKNIMEAYTGKVLNPVKRKIRNPLARRENDVPEDHASDHLPQWLTSRVYPVITYTDRGEIRQSTISIDTPQKKIEVGWLEDESIADRMEELLIEGGCAGIIVNTVRRAQQIARLLADRFGQEVVRLLHSRFVTPDRLSREADLLHELGKPGPNTARPELRIVVGTQVLEQSLDIDFDVLITDLCPMDLLLQRMGRLHRHDRVRPERLKKPLCFVLEQTNKADVEASINIYTQYLLLRTRARLPDHVQLPNDIPNLVQDVYDPRCALLPTTEDYLKSESDYRMLLEQKKSKADAYRLDAPDRMLSLLGWLDTNVSEKHGDAAVRDTEDSVEVLLVMRSKAGKFSFLPWIGNGAELDPYVEPPAHIARKLARCSIRLPAAVCGKYREFDATIAYLEQINREWLSAWQLSPWLRGELFLILDDQLTAEFGKFRLIYHRQYGLDYTLKEEDEDE